MEVYEETQGFSPTFRAFHEKLADDLIQRFDLNDKRILEIGCGKGEFLELLCHDGRNFGVGFDPAFREDRHPDPSNSNLRFVTEFYRDGLDVSEFDFICCKMTLEHIPNVREFLASIVCGLNQGRAQLFFQVPEMQRILKDTAFWDIYYEHCSYFSVASLTSVFQKVGLVVEEVWTDYDNQYLMISALWNGEPHYTGSEVQVPDELNGLVGRFMKSQEDFRETWKSYFENLKREGKSNVIWGGGSKTVAFVSFLGIEELVDGIVDINPYKQGTFIAGSGHKILSPLELQSIQPDVVVILNPIYLEEIKDLLTYYNLNPELKPVT
jgi:SAM-dependent methyltransferase